MAKRSPMEWLSYGAALALVAVTTNTPQFKEFENKLFRDFEHHVKPRYDRHVYFGSCAQARIQAALPLYKGDPGYRHGLDYDGNGIACDSPHDD